MESETDFVTLDAVPQLESKPGYQTTEFWVSLVSLLIVGLDAGGVLNLLPDRWDAIVAAVVLFAYNHSRGLAKQNIPYRP